MEFLALLVPHVLLRYQVVIRSYGAVSTTIRRQLGWIGKESGERQPPARALLEEEESGFVKVRRRSWARLIKKVWMEDPEVCWRCGERMEVLAAISSPAQDAVIEKVLRARGEWDPPWLRARPPRGPPSTGAGREGGPATGTRIEYEKGHDPSGEDCGFEPDPGWEATGPGA